MSGNLQNLLNQKSHQHSLHTSYIIPYFYIAELLSEYGYSEEKSAYLISVIGIFNTVGMVALGWVGDQKWCNVSKTYACCLVCEYKNVFKFM